MKKPILFIALVLLSFSSLWGQKPINTAFFEAADRFFQQNVQNGLVRYAGLSDNPDLKYLLKRVTQADLSGADPLTTQAFYINAYNLHVINAAAQRYPLQSVQEVTGFFDRRKVAVAGEELTLNQLEKNKLLKAFGDPRYHFVLVCGAVGCPPIIDRAYRPETLEQQLEQQARLALNDPNFIRVGDDKTEISQIFQWYPGDFGGSTTKIVEYINRYRETPIGSKIGYYDYDWKLNDLGDGSSSELIDPTKSNNASRYVVSAAIPKGGIEAKLFNNLYTQRTGDSETLTDRSTFLTGLFSFVYGVNNRFNVGFDARYRQVRNGLATDSPLAVFNPENSAVARTGLTAIGPKVRIAPFPALKNFSVQSSFVFSTGDDLAGTPDRPYIDWNGATWWTQFFNDFSVGNNFSIFTEVDFLWEDIGNGDNGNINRVSTPATLIFSYFPNPKTTFYALGGYSPFWQTEFDYFAQGGLGAKYQFTPNFELELLYTAFTNKGLRSSNGRAATYNLGVRYSLF